MVSSGAALGPQWQVRLWFLPVLGLLVLAQREVCYSSGTWEQELPQSAHAQALAAHRSDPHPPFRPMEKPSGGERRMAYTIFGYYPYWMSPTIRWDLVSHVAYFCVEADKYGNITATHGWPEVGLIDEAHSQGAKVVLTCTLFSYSGGVDEFVSDPGRRAMLISNLWALTDPYGADGVNIDFEFLIYPGSMYDFVAFMQELREVYGWGAHISVAGPAVDWWGSYNYEYLSDICDMIFIMGYNYHYAGSATTGAVAPLDGPDYGCVRWTVDDYLHWNGNRPAALVLGVPYYGYEWPAEGSYPGVPTRGTGAAYIYDVMESRSDVYGRLWDEPSSTPWYRYYVGGDGWYQGWYDDSESLGLKYDLVLEEELQGAGIWALGYDGTRPELWDTLEEKFGGTAFVRGEGAEELAASSVQVRAFPNPCQGSTTLEILVSSPGYFVVDIVDVNGRRICPLSEETLSRGVHRLSWDKDSPSSQGCRTRSAELASGVYFCRVLGLDGRAGVCEKIVVLK